MIGNKGNIIKNINITNTQGNGFSHSGVITGGVYDEEIAISLSNQKLYYINIIIVNIIIK